MCRTLSIICRAQLVGNLLRPFLHSPPVALVSASRGYYDAWKPSGAYQGCKTRQHYTHLLIKRKGVTLRRYSCVYLLNASEPDTPRRFVCRRRNATTSTGDTHQRNVAVTTIQGTLRSKCLIYMYMNIH